MYNAIQKALAFFGRARIAKACGIKKESHVNCHSSENPVIAPMQIVKGKFGYADFEISTLTLV